MGWEAVLWSKVPGKAWTGDGGFYLTKHGVSVTWVGVVWNALLWPKVPYRACLPNKAWVSVTWVGVGLDAVLWPKVPYRAWKGDGDCYLTKHGFLSPGWVWGGRLFSGLRCLAKHGKRVEAATQPSMGFCHMGGCGVGCCSLAQGACYSTDRGLRLLPNKAWVSVIWVGVGWDAVLWPKVPVREWEGDRGCYLTKHGFLSHGWVWGWMLFSSPRRLLEHGKGLEAAT